MGSSVVLLLCTPEDTHQLHELELGHNFLLTAANSSPLLTKHSYIQYQRLEMRPTSTIGTAYFNITDCTVNLSLSRAVTGRDNAISRHHLKKQKTACNFRKQDPSPALFSDRNCVQPLLTRRAFERETKTRQV